MELLRQALLVSAVAVLVFGPACILGVWWLHMARPPGYAKFTLAWVAGCSVVFWALSLLSDHILELQFRGVVPANPWAPIDEAA